MLEHKLQFTDKDVLKVLEDWKEKSAQDERTKTWIQRVVRHDFYSASSGFVNIYLLASSKKSNLVLNNIFQRAYAHNIHNWGRSYIHLCQEIVEGVTSPKEDEKKLDRLATNLHKTLEDLIQYLPITSTIERLGTLDENQRGHCNRADISAERTVYTANRIFGQYFQADKFYLKDDIEVCCIDLSNILGKENISLAVHPISKNIQTQVDYLRNVIEPLVWNAMEHAFTPENDVNGNMKDKEYQKCIFIEGYPKEIEEVEYGAVRGIKNLAGSGDYIVTVNDNGFGMPEEIVPHIFEEGFSTKKDKEHGIGLYGVKQFVEKYGGTIKVESKLGQGTTFEFTIPYSHVSDFVCVQAPVK